MMTKHSLRAILLLFGLLGSAFAQKQLPPEGGKPKDFKLPQKKTFLLKNGVGVTMVKYGTVPKVTVSVIMRAGNINESAKEVWLADLTGDMMKQGTTSRSAQDISREAALMGGSVDVSVGPDQTSFS